MMSPIDLTSAVRGGVFRALKAGVDPGLCAIFDDVPEGTQPQYLRVGVIESDPDGKTGQLEKMIVEVIAIYRGNDRGVLTRMMHAGRVALVAGPVDADGADCTCPRWLGGTAGLALQQDGITYAGLSHYEIWAEPA